MDGTGRIASVPLQAGRIKDSQKMYYVYIIWNGKAKKYYIGQTNNLEKRISQHNDPNNTYSKYTKQYKGLWTLIYFEEYLTREEAKEREKYLKNRRGREFVKTKILMDKTNKFQGSSMVERAAVNR